MILSERDGMSNKFFDGWSTYLIILCAFSEKPYTTIKEIMTAMKVFLKYVPVINSNTKLPQADYKRLSMQYAICLFN